MEIPQKLKIELTYEPAIPFLSIISKKIYAPQCSQQYYLPESRCGSNLRVD